MILLPWLFDKEQLVEVDLWSWERIPRPLLRWAWVVTGYFSYEEMAAMDGLTLAEVMDDSSKVNGYYKSFIELDSVPALPDKPEMSEGLTAPLVGEKLKLWLIAADTEANAIKDVSSWFPMEDFRRVSVEAALNGYRALLGRLQTKIMAAKDRG